MLSQAALSKIPELDVVLEEAGRSLSYGGVALFGLGAAQAWNPTFWTRKFEDRLLYCGDMFIAGDKVRFMVTATTPFDKMEGAGASTHLTLR